MNKLIKTITYYQKRKSELIEEAIEWQLSFNDKTYYWSELADYYEYFNRMGKRYGLLKEFKTNGIL